jgi:molybdopterin-containing oxidoreductase family membrane subunit
MNRALGPYQWGWLPMIICNTIVPQLFWMKWFRQNLIVVFIISIVVNVGMWFERFVIIVIGLHRDFLPSSWGYFKPTWVDVCTFIGTFGLFFTMFLLFIRFLPMIAISEVKGVTPEADPHHPLGGAKHEEVIPDDEEGVTT